MNEIYIMNEIHIYIMEERLSLERLFQMFDWLFKMTTETLILCNILCLNKNKKTDLFKWKGNIFVWALYSFSTDKFDKVGH